MEIGLKDPNILLSMINMKLRDMYSNLDNLCEDLDIDRVELENKLEEIGYSYNSSVNQFK